MAFGSLPGYDTHSSSSTRAPPELRQHDSDIYSLTAVTHKLDLAEDPRTIWLKYYSAAGLQRLQHRLCEYACMLPWPTCMSSLGRLGRCCSCRNRSCLGLGSPRRCCPCIIRP
jgi:hypothetical protein